MQNKTIITFIIRKGFIVFSLQYVIRSLLCRICMECNSIVNETGSFRSLQSHPIEQKNVPNLRTVRGKLQELKMELEKYKSVVDKSQKINEIRRDIQHQKKLKRQLSIGKQHFDEYLNLCTHDMTLFWGYCYWF